MLELPVQLVTECSYTLAEVGRYAIGDGNAAANHDRCLGKTSRSRGWLDACS